MKPLNWAAIAAIGVWAVLAMNYNACPFARKHGKSQMNRIEKLKNDVYSFEELNTLEKNATKLGDSETLNLITLSRASKNAKGEKPKPTVDEDGKPLTRRARREKNA